MKKKSQPGQLLYSSEDVHKAIKRVFSAPSANDRRVALVAYVGCDAQSYLPHPEGLHLICNPSAGGTDPDTIRSLIQRKARVQFSDGLHMKVYWSRARGCVITSANASSSALGRSGLKEAGIWLPPRTVDVDRLIEYANARNVTPKEIRLLDETTKMRRDVDHPKNRKQEEKDFLEWISSPHPKTWKLAWYDSHITGSARASKEATLAEYGRRSPNTWSCCAKGRIRQNDWLLCFGLTANNRVGGVRWQFVDFLVRISPREKKYFEKEWPIHAVQVHTLSKYPLPPFAITKPFRLALRRAVKRFEGDRIKTAKTDKPPRRLLRLIADELKALGRLG